MQFYLTRNKRPEEQFAIGVDFTKDLNQGDSLVSHEVSAIDKDGADVSAAFLGGATLSGNISLVIIQGGTEREKYRVFFKGTTAQGEVLEHSIEVQVRLDS